MKSHPVHPRNHRIWTASQKHWSHEKSRMVPILSCKYQISCSCWSHINIMYSELQPWIPISQAPWPEQDTSLKVEVICEKAASSPPPRPLEAGSLCRGWTCDYFQLRDSSGVQVLPVLTEFMLFLMAVWKSNKR